MKSPHCQVTVDWRSTVPQPLEVVVVVLDPSDVETTVSLCDPRLRRLMVVTNQTVVGNKWLLSWPVMVRI